MCKLGSIPLYCWLCCFFLSAAACPYPVNAGDSSILVLPPVLAAVSGCAEGDLLIHPEHSGPCEAGTQSVILNGYEWQRCDNGERYTWEEAHDYCRHLVLEGHCDWRLPSWEELKSLVVCTNGVPVPLNDYPVEPWFCGADPRPYDYPTIDPRFQAHSNYYWSSTSRDPAQARANALHFRVGGTQIMPVRSAELYVRCVRRSSGQ